MRHPKRTTLFLLPLILMLATGFSRKAPIPIRLEGTTMGTTYHITYFDKQKRNFKTAVDSLLRLVNKSINTYDPTAEVSRFNKSVRGVAWGLPYLYPPLKKAQEIFQSSHGAFDPTVMPLVSAWGFGPGKAVSPDSIRTDSLLRFVGFDKVKLSRDSVVKTDPRVQLDFGGIGQGYGADVVADFLKAKGIANMLVEIGGEGMAVGKNLNSGKPWQVGVIDPHSTIDHQFYKAYISLSNKSFTTSGSYFNYYEIDGRKYSHTIDPATGYPAQRALLSASVFSADCSSADAWATAFMVMGHEKAIELLKQHPELDAILIYSLAGDTLETFITPGLKAFVTLEP
ncbi:FAD:protein FMN transferase [Chryseolinea lacunae]|uniref:FAD:protein FMN transferase n=1 Tax=Chryseolinea lacunae TaxID=2801331 RepID=A0ABS1KSM6_9BACT|nr:FAD:protein FMN transferase [Chryseolinea lacunae]MBL0742262.1 FAD:protein FMN transferase [Chryseolinea lacunae]